MVLNSTFTKKTDRCWQDENIYLTKRFVIVIMHQLKGYFNVFSMTFCNKCVHKKYSKLLPLPSLDKNPRQEHFKSPPPTFFFLFLIQHFLKCGAASRHPAERGGGVDTVQEIFARVWGKRGTIHIWLGKQSNINAGGLFGKKGDGRGYTSGR